MRNAKLLHALTHVTLARRALSLAASDLAVVRYRGSGPRGATDELTIELERSEPEHVIRRIEIKGA